MTYKNEPLSGALVSFHPKGASDGKTTPPTGLTGKDGTFTVTTGKKEGAPTGEYVVTIICSVMPETTKKGLSTAGVDSEDRLQGAYANRDASKIRVEIKKGVNKLDPFDLK